MPAPDRMEPRIENIRLKKLIGMNVHMSFNDNRTFELWRKFMARINEIKNRIGPELYSVEAYPSGYFNNFDPGSNFEKWAAVEVSDQNSIPEGMRSLTVPEGLYAVFIHKGPANEGPKTYNYIFREWLPASDYVLGNRPHFAVMGTKYKNDSQDSEEELWIPVKNKSGLV